MKIISFMLASKLMKKKIYICMYEKYVVHVETNCRIILFLNLISKIKKYFMVSL